MTLHLTGAIALREYLEHGWRYVTLEIPVTRGDLDELALRVTTLAEDLADHVMLRIELPSELADDATVTITVDRVKPAGTPEELRRLLFEDVGPLEGLQQWYLAQCDGEWEHTYGVEIGTLDNPGWTLKIDVKETPPFTRLETHRGEDDWVVCWVEHDQFHAACGPLNLEEALGIFLDWAAD